MEYSVEDVVDALQVDKYYRVNTPVEYYLINHTDCGDVQQLNYARKEYLNTLNDIDEKLNENNRKLTKSNNELNKYLVLLNKKIQYLIHTTNKHNDEYKFAFVNISSKGLIIEIERAVTVDDDFKIYLFFLNTFDALELNAQVKNTVNLNNKIYVSADFIELSEVDEDRIIKNVFESERRSLQADKL